MSDLIIKLLNSLVAQFGGEVRTFLSPDQERRDAAQAILVAHHPDAINKVASMIIAATPPLYLDSVDPTGQPYEIFAQLRRAHAAELARKAEIEEKAAKAKADEVADLMGDLQVA